MFCITLSTDSDKELLERIKKGSKYTNFFEIRADYLRNLNLQWDRILELPYKFLFTFRSYKEGGNKKVPDEFIIKWILWASTQNFYLVDLEWRLFKKFFTKFKNFNPERFLFSYHNFKELSSEKYLTKLILEMKKNGVKKAKIVCMCKNLQESFKLLNLIFMAKENGIELISFGMGETAKLSRILSLFCGAPFTYVVLSKKEIVAPGQLDVKSAAKIYETLKKIM